MTWNLWWRFGDWETRQAGIDAEVARVKPDILCLQEVYGEEGGEHQADRLAEVMGGAFVAEGRRRYRNGLSFSNVVISRWPVTNSFRRHLPSARGAPSPRTLSGGLVHHPEGTLAALSTHISHKRVQEADRIQQCDAIALLVSEFVAAGHDVIIGADLNTESDAPSVQRLLRVTTDAWAADGGTARDAPDGRTWVDTNDHTAKSLWPNRRVDYVLTAAAAGRSLVTEQTGLAGTERHNGSHASDHYAVWADLTRVYQ